MNAVERNKMIEENMPLVGFALNLLQYDKSNYEDYFQQGCLQLIRCVDNYKPDSGKKFSTYAVKSIKWFLKEYIQRDMIIKPKVIDIKGHVEFVPCDSLSKPIAEGNKMVYLEDTLAYEDVYAFEKSNIEWCLDKLLAENKITKRNYNIFVKRIIEQETLASVAREYKMPKANINLITIKVLRRVKYLYAKMFPEEYEVFFNSYNKHEEK